MINKVNLECARRFLARKLEDCVIDDVVTIELTKWDTAFLIESLDELLVRL
jgi:hypothetical protein